MSGKDVIDEMVALAAKRGYTVPQVFVKPVPSEEEVRLRRLMNMGYWQTNETGQEVYVLDSNALRTYAELDMSICLFDPREAYLYDPEVYDELTKPEDD